MRDFFRSSLIKSREEQGRANPLFPAKKPSRIKRIILSLGILGAPIGGGILGDKILSLPQFQIRSIELTGTACLNQSVVKNDIEKTLATPRFGFFSMNNVIFFNEKILSEHLLRDFPLDHVTVTLHQGTLQVAVTENVVMVLFHSGDNWLLSDLQGTVLRTLSPEEIDALDRDTSPTLPFSKIPKILLAESVPADTKDPIFPPNRLAALGDLDKGLRLIGLTPYRYSLETKKDTWMSINTQEKPYAIYVDLEKPVKDQIAILASIIEKHEEIPGATYIDLRFGNRVYMK